MEVVYTAGNPAVVKQTGNADELVQKIDGAAAEVVVKTTEDVTDAEVKRGPLRLICN